MKYLIFIFGIFDTQNTLKRWGRKSVSKSKILKYFTSKHYDIGGDDSMISYAYARVSTKDQNLERQEIAIKEFRPDIPEHNIFKDKETGKNFDRVQYQAMKVILDHVVKVNGDKEIIEVIIEELDRLGRNSDGIKQELQWFKERGIVVRILELPTTLVDIVDGNKLLIDMITAILIEVYSVIAQQELEKRAKRQAEGIAVALEKGVRFGRKPIEVEQDEFTQIYYTWKSGNITARQAMQQLNLKPNTFYRRVRDYESQNNIKVAIN